jgi:hypothetical protein
MILVIMLEDRPFSIVRCLKEKPSEGLFEEAWVEPMTNIPAIIILASNGNCHLTNIIL